MSQPSHSTLLWNRPYPILIAAAAMWGGNTLFSRLAVGEISPMLLTLLRWAFVCAIAWALAGRDLKNHWPTLKPKIAMMSITGAIGFTGFNAFMYTAAHHTTAVNISIIQGAQPVMVMIGAAFLFHMAINWHQAAGIVLTLIGVAAIALRGELQTLLTLSFNLGDLFMLGACLCYALYTLALRSKPKVPGFLFFAVLASAATVASVPMVVGEYMAGAFVWPSLKGWIVTAAIVVLPSFLAQLFFIRGVELIGPARASLFINLVPVFGTIFAIFFLREPFAMVQGIGLLLVLLGIWLSEKK